MPESCSRDETVHSGRSSCSVLARCVRRLAINILSIQACDSRSDARLLTTLSLRFNAVRGWAMQTQAGFSRTPAVRRNNINLLRLFLSRWLYATPLDLEALLKHLAAGPPDEKAALDRRQFGMQLLVLGALPVMPWFCC